MALVRPLAAVLLVLSGAFGALPALGQAYPNRPIRLVVPWAPGGTGDLLARALVDGVGPLVKQTLLVDNRPGAGGTLGTASVARSPADGYTVLIGDIGPLAIAPSAYKSLAYEPLRDFVPVSIATLNSLTLSVHGSVGAATVQEFVQLAKARPGTLSYGSSGVGGVLHLAGELFKTMTDVNLLHVPYKGGSAAIAALVGGEVSASFSALPTTLPHTKEGRVRILGVTMDSRSQLAASIPTIGESGVPGYAVAVWQGVLVPAGTPRDVVQRLHEVVTEALRKPEIAQRLRSQGFEVVTSSPEEFASHIRGEIGKWSRVVKGAGIVLE